MRVLGGVDDKAFLDSADARGVHRVLMNRCGGAACHEGYRSCFFRRIEPANRTVEVVGERVFDPAQVYKKG